MAAIKVHYITHLLARTLYGGAETQIISTMKMINGLSNKYHVDLFNPWVDRIEEAGIIHIFNPRAFPIETVKIARLAKEKGLKLVFSPIFFHADGIETGMSYTMRIVEKLSGNMRRFLLRPSFSGIDPYGNLAQAFNEADLLMPNTNTEKKRLEYFFNLPESRCITVPNGVDAIYSSGDPDLFRQKYSLDEYILFIGRVEPQKNVLRLIRAFQQCGERCKLVIVGSEPNKDYAFKCKREANENILFLPPIEHDSEMLRSAYKGAKVFALPSYYETPGLAALEAGLAGANIVITKIGGTREYFDNWASYVDPLEVKSITEALKEACSRPHTENLSQRIAGNYTWDKVAKQTVKAYDSLESGH
jgi:glycosyltransferase involved in cell wall biosynthesis